MEFTIETNYDQKAMIALVRALRKTLGQKKFCRTRNYGLFAICLGIFLLLSANTVNFQVIITILAILIIMLALIFHDPINAYYTRKSGLPGLEKSTVRFHENGYHSVTALGESDFYYENIRGIIDTGDYLIFAFSHRHGQVYDKRTLTGGTIQEFEDFLLEKTGLQLKVA